MLSLLSLTEFAEITSKYGFERDDKLMTKQNKIKILPLYLIVFYGLWSLAELVIFERIDLLTENEILSRFITDVVIKNLVWTLPAVILIHCFKDDVYITLKQMFSSRVNWLRYIPIFLFFTVYILGNAMLQNGKLEIVNSFGFDDIIDLLFVGITEELVFRGWLLNVMFKEDKKWRCIFINSLLFLVIHFPCWIHQGVFISNFTSFSFLCLIMLSVIFSYTFIKSKNILVPIALHMYWDLLMFMLF